MPIPLEERRFSFLASDLALDFANTVDWWLADSPEDRFRHYGDLLIWAVKADVLPLAEAEGLAGEAAARPEEAAAVFARAIALRNALFRIFDAAARGGVADAASVAVLNGELGGAMAHATLVPAGGRYEWGWQEDGNHLDRMLWPVARAAADLLTTDRRLQVGACQDRHCGWLFLDTSRNKRRRWCSMEDCGNRNKARRFYSRKKGAGD
jgi:predicted RNA-binding Zn ribbon-like protein